MLRLVVLNTFIFLNTIFTFSQDLRFYEEALFFEIKGASFIVDGHYYFRNPGNNDVHKVLFYPFPQDEFLGEVDSLYISDASGLEDDLIIKQAGKGASFRLSVNSGQEKVYRIYYRQKITENHAKYILTQQCNGGNHLKKLSTS